VSFKTTSFIVATSLSGDLESIVLGHSKSMFKVFAQHKTEIMNA